MDDRLKRRLVGAAVIISLGIIFLPIILDGDKYAEFRKVHIKIPPAPEVGYALTIEPPAGEVKPELPIIAKPSAETAISRPLERTASARRDGIDRERSLLTPQAGITVVDTSQPAKTSEKAAHNNGKNLSEKPLAANTQSLAPKSIIASQSKPVPQPDPSGTEKMSSPIMAWVIQVGSFSSRTNALKLRDKLRDKGFTSFVESFENTGEASHRVRIGPEASRTRAEESLSRLKNKLAMNGIIVSYP